MQISKSKIEENIILFCRDEVTVYRLNKIDTLELLFCVKIFEMRYRFYPLVGRLKLERKQAKLKHG